MLAGSGSSAQLLHASSSASSMASNTPVGSGIALPTTRGGGAAAALSGCGAAPTFAQQQLAEAKARKKEERERAARAKAEASAAAAAEAEAASSVAVSSRASSAAPPDTPAWYEPPAEGEAARFGLAAESSSASYGDWGGGGTHEPALTAATLEPAGGSLWASHAPSPAPADDADFAASLAAALRAQHEAFQQQVKLGGAGHADMWSQPPPAGAYWEQPAPAQPSSAGYGPGYGAPAEADTEAEVDELLALMGIA